MAARRNLRQCDNEEANQGHDCEQHRRGDARGAFDLTHRYDGNGLLLVS